MAPGTGLMIEMIWMLHDIVAAATGVSAEKKEEVAELRAAAGRERR